MKNVIAKKLEVESSYLQLSLKKDEKMDENSRSNAVVVIATISYKDQEQLANIKALIKSREFVKNLNDAIKGVVSLKDVEIDKISILQGKL